MHRTRGLMCATRVASLLFALTVVLFAVPVFAHDTVYYYYTTPLHNVAVETDASGNVIERTYYAPYGQVLNREMRDGPGYTGHEEDSATGLVYMQQRYYDPTSGRFISTDPVLPTANGSNFNRYWYAKDNPYRYTDPDGRCADGTCDATVLNYGAWANANPEAADKLGSTVGVAGVTVMLSATGLSEAVGLAKGAVVVDKALSDAREASAGKTYTTYTRAKTDGTVYSGRTSGTKTPERQVAARTSQPDHQSKTAEGYGPAKVDRNSSNPDAIRGREQQLIEQHGGAQSQGGTSGNKINGVSPNNPNATRYQTACNKESGCG